MTVKKTVLLDSRTAQAVRKSARDAGTSESALMAAAIDDFVMRRAIDSLNVYVAHNRDSILTEFNEDTEE